MNMYSIIHDLYKYQLCDKEEDPVVVPEALLHTYKLPGTTTK